MLKLINNDVLDGEWKEFWDNGNLRILHTYKNNVFNGPCRKFNYNGELIEECFYNYGIKESQINFIVV